MSVILRWGCVALLTCTAAASSVTQHPNSADVPVTQPQPQPPPLAHSEAAIRRNAFSIFNAVHSAMRQWGSALNHNGMSLMLATVPEGQLFYHGGPSSDRPQGINESGFDWLAFEPEHAQMFARSRDAGFPRPGGHAEDAATIAQDYDYYSSRHYMYRGALENDEADQKTLESYEEKGLHEEGEEADEVDDDDDDDDDDDEADDDDGDGAAGPHYWPAERGYFHTYRANRPLNLLVIDGMGAGKADYGCLDSQDLLLLDWSEKEEERRRKQFFNGEIERAGGLCDLARDWAWGNGVGDRIDGFIRAEAGFEIIYCDFSAEASGLDVVSIQPSPFANQTGGLPAFIQAEFLRGVAQRYHGFPAGRIHVDWSSMVSAFFYNVNLTNPDFSRPELPRLSSATRNERRAIRSRLQEVVAARARFAPHRGKAVVDWQGIVDLVVTRFSRRLDQLVRDTSAPITHLASRMLPTFIYSYVNYTDPDEPQARQMERCTQHYLTGALALESLWTPEDKAIYLAVQTVTETICQAVFDIHAVLYNETANGLVDSSSVGVVTKDEQNQQDEKVLQIVQGLMGKLQWTTWQECDPCQKPDEMCLVAMFPWGNDEDHFHPQCKVVENWKSRSGYWNKVWGGDGQ